MKMMRKTSKRAGSGWPAAAMLASACLAGGCGASGELSRAGEMPADAYVEVGAADGAAAGERDAWIWWNELVARYDGAFAGLIARSNPEIEPPRVRYTEWNVIESTHNRAVVEQGVWSVDPPRLAPNGPRGFAETLSVRFLPVEEEMNDKDDVLQGSKLYRDAYVRAWAAAYSMALFDREIALDDWVEDRYDIYRADVLIANGQMVAPKVDRVAEPVGYQPYRKAELREVWTMIGGNLSIGFQP